MNKTPTRFKSTAEPLLILLALLVSACQVGSEYNAQAMPFDQEASATQPALAAGEAMATPLPTRPAYSPGELVDYVAQTGDTLPALAAHFNTTVAEIRQANPIIPPDAATMPPGMPMKIPIYYAPLWGSPFKILPDSLFVNGPSQVDFNAVDFVNVQPGWLKDYVGYVAGANRRGGEIVEVVARNFSISPRLLLALLEYHAQALTQPEPPEGAETYTLGVEGWRYRGVYLQLVWAANTLNNGYYGWRIGNLQIIQHQDGTIERPDPWQNAASVALQYYFSRLFDGEGYQKAISPEGFAATYRALFGDPWQADQPHLPGSLRQPELALPFEPGKVWALTGGPHTGWGSGEPLAALDFAPPSVASGCIPTDEWATAVAAGMVVRSEDGVVTLDLDFDGDQRTGWVIFYLHVGSEGRAPLGAQLQIGDPIGHPSCEGGSSTGTHIHIARLYNGEWIPADGPLAFNLEGWIAHNGAQPYLGTLKRYGSTVTACTCSNAASFIRSDRR